MGVDKYQAGDRVFAKMKGYPPWPARVIQRKPGKAESYEVRFYGTDQVGFIKPDQMHPYTEINIGKFGNTKKAGFKEAMEQIEANFDFNASVSEIDTSQEEPTSDGELMIDEDESPGPPVLQREVDPEPEPVVETKVKPATPVPPPVVAKPRRLSKNTKRDSTSTSTPSASTNSESIASTPVQETSTPPAQPEIVSRSGRKIKPKRFADDEIASPVTTLGKSATNSPANTPKTAKTPATKGKTSSAPVVKRGSNASSKAFIAAAAAAAAAAESPVDTSESEKIQESEEPPPAKRAKRASSTKSSQKPAEKPESTPVPKAEKGNKPAPRTSVRSSSRKSSAAEKAKETEPSPPVIAPASTAASSGLVLAKKSSPSDKSVNPLSQAVEIPELKAKSEGEADNAAPVLSPPQNTEGEDKKDVDQPQPSPEDVKSEKDEEMNDTDDKENMGEIQTDELSNHSESHREPKDEEEYAEEPLDNNIKCEVVTKCGVKVELEAQVDENDDEQDKERKAENILKLKEEMESNYEESVEILNHAANALVQKEPSIEDDVVISRSRRYNDLRILRLEGELIEIIGEIVGCLNVDNADCDRAFELLERFGEHELTPLMLKKNPEVVDVMRRLRCYVGNVRAWKLPKKEADEFDRKSLKIRDKAADIYENMKSLFCTTPEDHKNFLDLFNEEVEKFKASTEGMDEAHVLSLTTEIDTDNDETLVPSTPATPDPDDVKKNGDIKVNEATKCESKTPVVENEAKAIEA